jgi:hypothetical protein
MKKLKAPDKLDKYRSHLLEGDKLNPQEALMLERYKKANALMCQGHTLQHVKTMLEKLFDLSESQTYMIMRDSIKLFGDVTKADKEGKKQIMYEVFMRDAKIAQQNGDYKAMVKAHENAAKILDLFNPNQSLIDPKKFLLPVPIIFSSDPEILKEQQTEDTDYAELE